MWHKSRQNFRKFVTKVTRLPFFGAIMKKILHTANTRGSADYGWLQANYSFSFANYFDPKRLQFGLLRVMNDDTVAPGMGFGKHPHENMEIVTIPQTGALKHRDSMGNEGVVKAGDIQVMSAGSGVEHSEINASSQEPVTLFQIWVFPETENVSPRYDQKKISSLLKPNSLTTVVAPKDKASNKRVDVPHGQQPCVRIPPHKITFSITVQIGQIPRHPTHIRWVQFNVLNPRAPVHDPDLKPLRMLNFFR